MLNETAFDAVERAARGMAKTGPVDGLDVEGANDPQNDIFVEGDSYTEYNLKPYALNALEAHLLKAAIAMSMPDTVWINSYQDEFDCLRFLNDYIDPFPANEVIENLRVIKNNVLTAFTEVENGFSYFEKDASSQLPEYAPLYWLLEGVFGEENIAIDRENEANLQFTVSKEAMQERASKLGIDLTSAIKR